MENYSIREMIDYSQTRGKEDVIRIKAWLDLIEAFVNVLDRTFEIGLLFRCKARCSLFMCWSHLVIRSRLFYKINEKKI